MKVGVVHVIGIKTPKAERVTMHMVIDFNEVPFQKGEGSILVLKNKKTDKIDHIGVREKYSTRHNTVGIPTVSIRIFQQQLVVILNPTSKVVDTLNLLFHEDITLTHPAFGQPYTLDFLEKEKEVEPIYAFLYDILCDVRVLINDKRGNSVSETIE